MSERKHRNCFNCLHFEVHQYCARGKSCGHYEDKALFAKLPCPIGTTVYILCKNQQYINVGRFKINDLSEWGKRIFATPEEALQVAPNAELCKAAKLIINGDRENGNA